MKKLTSVPLILIAWTIVTAFLIPLLGNHDLGIGGFYSYLYDGPLTIFVGIVGLICMGFVLLFGNQWLQGNTKTSWTLLIAAVFPYLAGSLAAIAVSNQYSTIVGPGGYGAFHGAVIANNLKFVGTLFSLALVLSSAHCFLTSLIWLKPKHDPSSTYSSNWFASTGMIILLGTGLILAAEIYKLVWTLTYTSAVMWTASGPSRLEGMHTIYREVNVTNYAAMACTALCVLAAIVGLKKGFKQSLRTRLPKSAFALGIIVPLMVGGVAIVPISAGIDDSNEALGINRYLSTLTQKNPSAEAIALGNVTTDVKIWDSYFEFRTGEVVSAGEISDNFEVAVKQEIRNKHIGLVQKNMSTFSGKPSLQPNWPTSPHISFSGTGRNDFLTLDYFIRIFTKAQIRTVRYIPDNIEPPISGKRPLWFYLYHPDLVLGQNQWTITPDSNRAVFFTRQNAAGPNDTTRIDLNKQNNYVELSKQINSPPNSDAPLCIIPISTIRWDLDFEAVLCAGHAVNCTMVVTTEEDGIFAVEKNPALQMEKSVGNKFSIVPKTDSYTHQTEFKKQLKAAQKLSKQKNWSQAVNAFEEMNTQFPNTASVLGELTWAAFNAQNYDLVATVGAHAVTVNENDLSKASTLYNMGRAEQARNNMTKAVEYYLHSFKLRKNKQVQKLLLELAPDKKETIEKFNNNWRAYNPKERRFRFQEKMVHPHCLSELMGGFEPASTARKHVSLLECTKDEELFKKTAHTATFETENEYASYTVFANKKNRFLIDYTYGEGGTQTRETLLVVELQGDEMLFIKEIHSGDRCDNGYLDVKPSIHKNKTSYSYSLWARDALNLDALGKTLNTGGCKYGDCLSSAMLYCYIVATFEYNLLTGQKELKHITIDGENVDDSNNSPKRICFDQFSIHYSGKRKIRFNPQQFAIFTKAYANKCLQK